MPADKETKIKGILGWEQAKLSIPTQQIYKMYYQTSVFEKPPTLETLKKWEQELSKCFKALDDLLVNGKFLCGDSMTLADIVVFSDVAQFVEMNKFTADSPEMSYPNLMRWYSKSMMGNASIKAVMDEFANALYSTKKAKLM